MNMPLDLLRASTALLACAVCATSAAQEAASASDALAATRLLLDTRLRFEGVDQDGLPNDAEALTWRARLGFETGKLWNTSLLAEGDFIWPLTTDYNSTTNGRTAYPVVADPETYEVNRLQLTNTSIPMTVVTVGRQRITLDDHRFVGDVGWRQNDQTFDSLRVVNTSLPNTTFDVSYVSQVNRVFGKDSLQGRYEGDSVLA